MNFPDYFIEPGNVEAKEVSYLSESLFFSLR